MSSGLVLEAVHQAERSSHCLERDFALVRLRTSGVDVALLLL